MVEPLGDFTERLTKNVVPPGTHGIAHRRISSIFANSATLRSSEYDWAYGWGIRRARQVGFGMTF
jgi:hypothetical protein